MSSHFELNCCNCFYLATEKFYSLLLSMAVSKSMMGERREKGSFTMSTVHNRHILVKWLVHVKVSRSPYTYVIMTCHCLSDSLDVIMDMLGKPRMRQVILQYYIKSREPKLVEWAIQRARYRSECTGNSKSRAIGYNSSSMTRSVRSVLL